MNYRAWGGGGFKDGGAAEDEGKGMKASAERRRNQETCDIRRDGENLSRDEGKWR